MHAATGAPLLGLERQTHVELVARVGQEHDGLLERRERAGHVGVLELVLALLVERLGFGAIRLVRRRAAATDVNRRTRTGRRQRWLDLRDARTGAARLREQLGDGLRDDVDRFGLGPRC